MMTFFTFARFILLLSLFSCCCCCFADDLVQDICSKTRNPSFCLQFFNHDHGSNLHGLGLKAIDAARTSARDTDQLIISLVKGTTDPSLKEKYKSCLENYDDAISNLDEARNSFNDPQGMNLKVSAAMTNVDTCEEGFGKSPVKPPKLKFGDDYLTNLCSIILVISNKL